MLNLGRDWKEIDIRHGLCGKWYCTYGDVSKLSPKLDSLAAGLVIFARQFNQTDKFNNYSFIYLSTYPTVQDKMQ